MRYLAKKYKNNNTKIQCSCGCGESLLKYDIEGRERKFISGHNNRKYEDKTQYKREWNHRNRAARYKYKTERAHKLKAKLIGLKGDKCVSCEIKYNGKNACIFDFHHIDPKKRSARLNLAMLQNLSLKIIYSEIKKCDLICSNCHRKHHSSEY